MSVALLRRQSVTDPLKPGFHLVCQRRNIASASDPQHHCRFDKTYRGGSVSFFPDNHITRQQQTNIRVGFQRLVCQLRITGSKNPVGGTIDIQFLFQGRLNIDLGLHPETLVSQRAGHGVDRFFN
jgi:hypothetical protein